jgi:hypothetical protein
LKTVNNTEAAKLQVIAAVLLNTQISQNVDCSKVTDVSEELSITGSGPSFPEDAAVERRFPVRRCCHLSQ